MRAKTSEHLHHPPSPSRLASEVKAESEKDEDEKEESESESDTPPSPRSQPHMHIHHKDPELERNVRKVDKLHAWPDLPVLLQRSRVCALQLVPRGGAFHDGHAYITDEVRLLLREAAP